MKKILLFACLSVSTFFTAHRLFAQTPESVKSNHVAGEILFQLIDNQPDIEIWDSILGDIYDTPSILKTTVQQPIDFQMEAVSNVVKIYKIKFDSAVWDENSVLKVLKKHPSVKNAHFNSYLELRGNPNDPSFSQQWYFSKINAPTVWDKTTGGVTACGDTIVVAILDAGFYDKTADLSPNIWTNKDEIPFNGIDDDGNGKVDDYRGFNLFINKDSHTVLIPSFMERGVLHGTKAAGMIGAKGNNNLSGTGINWNIKILLLSGVVTWDRVYSAFEYVYNMRKAYNTSNGKKGAFIPITSMSLGQSNVDLPPLCAWYDKLAELNILNFAAADNATVDNTTQKDMPTWCDRSNLIIVSGTDTDDKPVGAFSNKFIHIAAPAKDLPLLNNDNTLIIDSGNSFATPLVAGSAALLMSIKDGGKYCQLAKQDGKAAMLALKDAILRGADKPTALAGKNTTSGRFNLKRSYDLMSRAQPIGDFDILQLSPNPVHGTLNLTFQLPEAVNANVVVVNTLGQIVYDKKIADTYLLKNPYPIDTKNWASGLYIIAVRTNDFEVSRKFVVSHK